MLKSERIRILEVLQDSEINENDKKILVSCLRKGLAFHAREEFQSHSQTAKLSDRDHFYLVRRKPGQEALGVGEIVVGDNGVRYESIRDVSGYDFISLENFDALPSDKPVAKIPAPKYRQAITLLAQKDESK